MKDKSLQEKNAAERQVELITSALGDAADCKGYWLNAAGKNMPKFYPKGVSVSPFNALVMGLNADRNGYKTNLYTLYNDAKNRGESVREHEKGVPFNWYNWSKYVNRHNPEDIIPRKDYLTLSKKNRSNTKACITEKSVCSSILIKRCCPWPTPIRMRRCWPKMVVNRLRP